VLDVIEIYRTAGTRGQTRLTESDWGRIRELDKLADEGTDG